MPFCLACGSGIDEYDSGYYARNMMCIPCYGRKMSEVPMISCSRCGVRIKQQESKERGGNRYCYYCASEKEREARMPVCPICKSRIEEWQKSITAPDGKAVHASCRENERKMALKNAIYSSPPPRRQEGTILRMMIGRVSSMFG